ncbi:unnamed protein product (macronuclear) [Paramecium tetraurelia]|uniref:Uncharacterized protein n=1 Tax=Paramecium tetraurelia TaxID=5888 RepID=A0C266_PARTE|nr:uncharacterized protein GSPATT00034360001 [Paramecium tetraurelia]CAK64883.1 unnamed protein product [Paramecium tetraurelia]|eukprot:XP_001432280.1 hypothetical protein (macronuclear) [Paramecium tetraurelia strain d4-2]
MQNKIEKKKKYFEWLFQNNRSQHFYSGYKQITEETGQQLFQYKTQLPSDQLSIHDQESFLTHDNFEIPHFNWKFLSETTFQSAYMKIDEGNQIEVYSNTREDQVIFFGRYQNHNKDGLWQIQYCLKQQEEFLPMQQIFKLKQRRWVIQEWSQN